MSSEEKEKKSGGALPPWMSSGARVGSMTRGGSAVGGRLGSLRVLAQRLTAAVNTKLGAAAVVALLMTVSGFGLADMTKRGGFGVEAPRKALSAPSFRSSYNPDGQRDAAYGASGLDMASKANKGAFDEGAPSADAPAPTGEGSKDAAAGGEETPQAPAVDAAAMAQAAGAAAAQGGGKALPNAGYGKFSSGMGGLAGGGGMAGGVGQSFQSPKLGNAQLAQAKAFNNPSTGKVSRGMTPARNMGRSAMKGANARRLDDMNRAMGATRRSGAESAAATQTQQWSNGAPTGSGIQGAGVGGAGTGGQISGDEGVGDGDPVGNPTATPPQTEPPPVDGGKNVTPYQSQVDMAVIMLAACALLMAIAYGVSKIKGWPPALAVACFIAKLAAVCAAMAALCGVMMMASGQMAQGAIFTVCGALGAYLAWTSVAENPQALIGNTVLYAAAVSAGGAIAGSLMKDKAE
ncbi:MAG: hypothetical protein WC969_06855 [Elusimicrobiota bacterium]|jgi:hypothetical protein